MIAKVTVSLKSSVKTQRCVLTDDFKETVTLARFHRMLPDDGPKGPKHVGAI